MIHCSFCKKSQRDVRMMIAGPNVYICDECVDICFDIIARQRDRPIEGNRGLLGGTPSAFLKCSLCSIPTTLSESLAVPERGIICHGCVGAFEAALAERDAKDSR